jgi:hypothetical protein
MYICEQCNAVVTTPLKRYAGITRTCGRGHTLINDSISLNALWGAACTFMALQGIATVPLPSVLQSVARVTTFGFGLVAVVLAVRYSRYPHPRCRLTRHFAGLALGVGFVGVVTLLGFR